MTNTDNFLLGVNYWPRKQAMFMWAKFDAAGIREEFALIRELGMKVVRIFLMWEDFQPTPTSVSETALRNLETVCNLAAEHDLWLDITFFTGHMSGPNWSPGWLLDPHEPPLEPNRLISGGKPVNNTGYRNYFTDETALNAQRLLLETVVRRLKDHPGVWMWNLGNEPDLFALAPNRDIGRAWVREMSDRIKAIDPAHLVTCGLHVASLLSPKPLRVDDTFAAVDVAVMHGYPMYISWVENPLDTDFVPFMCALVTALCGKPTLMEEWGGCTAPPGEPSQVWEWVSYGKPRTQFMASEEAFAAYIEKVQHKLIEVGALGSMLWCFADYARELWDQPPCAESWHERHFGLIRPDGSLKPHAQAVQRFAQTNPKVQPATRTVTLDISPDEYYADPDRHMQRLFQQFKGL